MLANQQTGFHIIGTYMIALRLKFQDLFQPRYTLLMYFKRCYRGERLELLYLSIRSKEKKLHYDALFDLIKLNSQFWLFLTFFSFLFLINLISQNWPFANVKFCDYFILVYRFLISCRVLSILQEETKLSVITKNNKLRLLNFVILDLQQF